MLYLRAGLSSFLFPNRVKDRWKASAPLQIVVSDMTIFKVGRTY